MIKNQRGQGLIEIIFSVGVLVIVITAVVSLIVKTTGLKSLAAQRKKASEMSEVIIENLMNEKKTNTDVFWQLDDITTPQVISGYDGYKYVVDFSPTSDGNCSDTVTECANALITISWGNNQTFAVNRFFSKKI